MGSVDFRKMGPRDQSGRNYLFSRAGFICGVSTVYASLCSEHELRGCYLWCGDGFVHHYVVRIW